MRDPRCELYAAVMRVPPTVLAGCARKNSVSLRWRQPRTPQRDVGGAIDQDNSPGRQALQNAPCCHVRATATRCLGAACRGGLRRACLDDPDPADRHRPSRNWRPRSARSAASPQLDGKWRRRGLHSRRDADPGAPVRSASTLPRTLRKDTVFDPVRRVLSGRQASGHSTNISRSIATWLGTRFWITADHE